MRILFNTTYKVDHSVVETWLDYINMQYAVEMMETGFFSDWKLLKIIGDDSADGITFAIHFVAHNMDAFLEFSRENEAYFNTEMNNRFSGKFGAFQTLMEIVTELV